MARCSPPHGTDEALGASLILVHTAPMRRGAQLARAENVASLAEVAHALRSDKAHGQVQDGRRDTLEPPDWPQGTSNEDATRWVVTAHGVGRARMAECAAQREEPRTKLLPLTLSSPAECVRMTAQQRFDGLHLIQWNLGRTRRIGSTGRGRRMQLTQSPRLPLRLVVLIFVVVVVVLRTALVSSGGV